MPGWPPGLLARTLEQTSQTPEYWEIWCIRIPGNHHFTSQGCQTPGASQLQTQEASRNLGQHQGEKSRAEQTDYTPVLTPPVRIQAPVVTAALIRPWPTTRLMRGCSSKF